MFSVLTPRKNLLSRAQRARFRYAFNGIEALPDIGVWALVLLFKTSMKPLAIWIKLTRFLAPLLFLAVMLPELSYALPQACVDAFSHPGEKTAASLLTPPGFEEIEITLFNKQVQALRVKSSDLKKGLISTAKLAPEKAVFIGIDPYGHMYIVAGKYRFDGNMFLKPSSLRSVNFLSQGIVIRIEDQDGAILNNVVNYLRNGATSSGLTCVGDACTIINQATDLNVNDERLYTNFPVRFLRQVIEHGFTSQTANGLDVQIIVIGDSDPKSLIRSMSSRTNRAGIKLGLVGAALLSLPMLDLMF